MKKSIKTSIFTATATLIIGLLLGWLLFGTSEHTHGQEKHAVAPIIDRIWTCAMHPQIRRNAPGTCPICTMKLVALNDENMENMPNMGIAMSPTAMKLADVSTEIVGNMLEPTKRLRLSGKIQLDERLIFSQTVHTSGRIERLMHIFTGKYVGKATPIAELYSPDLVTAQEALLEAWRIKIDHPQLYKAARERLKSWKLIDSQINAIIKAGKPTKIFPILSDFAGHVIEKKVKPGDYVATGQVLYKVANLSKVWALFDIYEGDLAWIKPGDRIHFTVAALQGETFEGRIAHIDPIIDPKTRVAQARIEVHNKELKLKPEMFTSGTLEAHFQGKKNAVFIPKTAVMWTGKRSVVYVKKTTPEHLNFVMREVILGPALGIHYMIEAGLEPGEEIATHGTFSIDAAAQLAGKPSMMHR